MGLSDGCLVRFQDHLGAVIVDMERSEDQDKPGEGLEIEQTTKHKLFTQGNKVFSQNKCTLMSFAGKSEWISSGIQGYEFNTIHLILV